MILGIIVIGVVLLGVVLVLASAERDKRPKKEK